MKRTEGFEVILWECPYKKCQMPNETPCLEKLKNGNWGAECSYCGNIVQID